VKRRTFLRHVVLSGPAAAIGWPGIACADKPKWVNPSVTAGQPSSRVVIAHRSDLRTSSGAISEQSCSRLLDTAVENLFSASASDIWSTLFSPRDVVGLKVNCLAGRGLSTCPELVEAVVERLLRAGLSPERIIIWDRFDRDLERGGYRLFQGRGKPQCFATDRVGYTPEIYEYGSVGSQLSRVLSDLCTAVINLPVLKDHGIVGVSVALKNFFGAINNPHKYHEGVGDPYVADLNMLDQIRNKTRLTICDASAPQYQGGPPYMPEWTWTMDSLIAATDMVAMDRVGWQIIARKRAEVGLPTLAAEGREPTYIATAADPAHRLGAFDDSLIEIVSC